MCIVAFFIMSQQELVAYITEENKRRKRKRILLTKQYFEMSCLAFAYVSSQRAPRNLGCFDEEEEKVAYRKYILKQTYEGSETTCYDKLRLTKRNFHDLCAMLREKCGLKDSTFVTVEENVAMFLQVVGHGLKMRMLGGTYQRSLETISRHLSTVLSAIMSLTGEFIKLPEHGTYSNRHQDINTNMLGVGDWNMKFLYVLPGWEGSASDSRVLKDAMRIDREDAFVVPQGMTLSLCVSFLICTC